MSLSRTSSCSSISSLSSTKSASRGKKDKKAAKHASDAPSATKKRESHRSKRDKENVAADSDMLDCTAAPLKRSPSVTSVKPTTFTGHRSNIPPPLDIGAARRYLDESLKKDEKEERDAARAEREKRHRPDFRPVMQQPAYHHHGHHGHHHHGHHHHQQQHQYDFPMQQFLAPIPPPPAARRGPYTQQPQHYAPHMQPQLAALKLSRLQQQQQQQYQHQYVALPYPLDADVRQARIESERRASAHAMRRMQRQRELDYFYNEPTSPQRQMIKPEEDAGDLWRLKSNVPRQENVREMPSNGAVNSMLQVWRSREGGARQARTHG